MYIAKIGDDRYIIKRMPETGYLHSPDCDSYDPPPELSGLGDMLGTAIKECAEGGITELKFDFSISKVPGRYASQKNDEDLDSVKTDGNKLTLRSTLHFLWEEAGFHKWSPAMDGKRSWYVVRKYLLQACINKTVKGLPLVDRIYIPDVFTVEKKAVIAQHRMGQMSRMATSSTTNARQLMILIGEVKEIAPGRYGHKLIVKHAPDFPFMLNDDIYKRLNKRFGREFEMWEMDGTVLMTIATFSVSANGIASIEEMALMTVNNNWIPFETIHDRSLIEMLTLSGRRFMKSLRYNMAQTKPLACAVLTDTAPQPTALYIVPVESGEDIIAAGNQLREESHLASWIWNTSVFEIPPLPDAVANS